MTWTPELETKLLEERAERFRRENPDSPHNPYDISTWGKFCGSGMAYRDHGTVTDGQKGAVRKLGGSRKSRGLSSDGLERSERLKR